MEGGEFGDRDAERKLEHGVWEHDGSMLVDLRVVRFQVSPIAVASFETRIAVSRCRLGHGDCMRIRFHLRDRRMSENQCRSLTLGEPKLADKFRKRRCQVYQLH